MISALRIAKHLKEGVRPAYLVLGSDFYLKKLALDAFTGLVESGWRQFNIERFGGAEKKGQPGKESEEESQTPLMIQMRQAVPQTKEDVPLQRALEAAQTLPMMSPYRVVILEDISKLKDEQWDKLYAYLERPNPKTVLVMTAPRLHYARETKIAKSADIVSAGEPSPGEVRTIAERSFQKDGYELAPGVVDELMDQVGTNVQALSQQIEKLKLFRLQEKSITVDDVHDLSNRSRTHEIWDLINLIATKDRRQLLVLLQRFFDEGAVPLVLLKTIYSHVAALLAVKELAGKPEGAIAKITGMSPGYVRRLSDQARRFQAADLKAALRELHQTDSALKGRGLSDRLLLEILLIRIVGS